MRQRRKHFYLLPKAKETAVLVLCSPSSCSTYSQQLQQNHWSLLSALYHWFQNRESQVWSSWTQVPPRQFHHDIFSFLAFLSQPFAKQSISHTWHVKFIHLTQYEGKTIGNMIFIKTEEEPIYYRNCDLKSLRTAALISRTSELLWKVPWKGPPQFFHLASGTVTEPHYQGWIMV